MTSRELIKRGNAQTRVSREQTTRFKKMSESDQLNGAEAIQNEKQDQQATCAFFVARKKRKCRMLVKSGKRFCGEHCAAETDSADVKEDTARMPCPYDPNHSCFVSRLEKHLKRCNSRPKDQPDYINPGVNLLDGNATEIKVSLGSLTDEELLAFIERVKTIHSEHVGCIPDSIKYHKLLKSTLANLQESRGSFRHVTQNSSILQNMEEAGLLASEGSKTFVEFGSGRGQLGYYLGQILNQETQSLLLIDKTSPRHKHENRFKVDGAWDCPVERIRADISDVDLSLVPQIVKSQSIVGTGKHLCGGATDLALQSLHNAVRKLQKPIVQGVCIALCCHHQCTWNTYVGKSFLEEVRLSQRDFAVLRAMTSWATCGARSAVPAKEASNSADKTDQVDDDEHATQEKDGDPALSRYAILGLDAETREELGRQCKQIIDQGRIKFLLSDWSADEPFKSARLVHYVSRDISLENVLLLATF